MALLAYRACWSSSGLPAWWLDVLPCFGIATGCRPRLVALVAVPCFGIANGLPARLVALDALPCSAGCRPSRGTCWSSSSPAARRARRVRRAAEPASSAPGGAQPRRRAAASRRRLRLVPGLGLARGRGGGRARQSLGPVIARHAGAGRPVGTAFSNELRRAWGQGRGLSRAHGHPWRRLAGGRGGGNAVSCRERARVWVRSRALRDVGGGRLSDGGRRAGLAGGRQVARDGARLAALSLFFSFFLKKKKKTSRCAP